MDLKTISLFLALITLAQCNQKIAYEVIGSDSELVDVSSEILTKKSRVAPKGTAEVSNEGYTKEDVIHEKYTKEDVTKERNAKKDISNEKYTKEDETNERYAKEDVSNEKYNKEDVTKEIHSKKDVSNEKYTKEDVIKERHANKHVSNEKYTKEDETNEKYTKEDVSNEKYTKEDVTVKDGNKKGINREGVSKEDVSKEKYTKEYVTNEAKGAYTKEDVTKEKVTPSRRFFHLLPRRQCACFPGKSNGVPISNYLRPKPGSQYERLVVYIFKNTATNEIKTYVPNAAKQIIFPDIIYDNDDALNTLNENVIQIIKNNFGPVIKSWITLGQKPHKPEINLDIFGSLNQQKLKALLLYLRRYKETNAILDSLTGSTIIEKLIQLKKLYPKIYENFILKITKFFPAWLINGQIIRYKPGHLINFPYDISLIPALNGKQVNEIIVYKPPNIDISHNYPVINVGITFVNWLKILTNYLNTQLQFVSKPIDGVALKSYIIKILNKAGFSISQNGYLIDAAGSIINLANIILRPILIGESTLVSSVINNGLFQIPIEIVFIEVLLLTGGHSKSLGIIPIGNIFVGAKQIKVSTVVEVIETIVTCEDGTCHTVKKCKNLKGDEIPCENANKSGKDVVDAQPKQVEKIASRSGKSRSGSVIKIKCKKNRPCPYYPYYIQPHSVSPNIIDLLNNNYALYIDGALTQSGDMSSVMKPSPAINKISVSRADVSSSLPFPDDDSYHGRSASKKRVVYINRKTPKTRIIPGIISHKQGDIPFWVNEEEPGIRIIGGGPATSSGTPVNSKGRSGIPDIIMEKE